jgi:M3 family oligoendopeptidase
MLKFAELPYKRPDIEDLKKSFNTKIEQIKEARDGDTVIKLIKEVNELRSHFDTMSSLANVRYASDTRNEEYQEERQFFDENSPEYSQLIFDFYTAVLDSGHMETVKEEIGEHYIELLRLKTKTFSYEIIPLLREENKLRTRYIKLMAGIEVEYLGESYNLGAMAPFMQTVRRSARKEASEAYYEALHKHREEMDEIYDKLVKVRTECARALGYENFVQMGYDRLLRYDYGPKEVAYFRGRIEELVVPYIKEFKRVQAERIGVESLKHYDEAFKFPDGNPFPEGDPEEILEEGRGMYKDLSPETHKFFEELASREMMDLENRSGKQGGGFCTYFPDFKTPFIFSNFNGTAHDIEVLTHEAGHAFQVYCSSHHKVNEYWWPTLEAAEIHSMSMEFFTWPFMERFFGHNANKFRYDHIISRLSFQPYGCAIDEFQEQVYSNPDDTPEQRLERWKAIEKRFMPWRDNDKTPFLEEGRFWQRQGHLFRTPFYYIDYALAQVCALQFWKQSTVDFKGAWSRYVYLCKAGGSKPFLELIDMAGLKTPFLDITIGDVTTDVTAWVKVKGEKNISGDHSYLNI